jgi:hypothetical protein
MKLVFRLRNRLIVEILFNEIIGIMPVNYLFELQSYRKEEYSPWQFVGYGQGFVVRRRLSRLKKRSGIKSGTLPRSTRIKYGYK